MIIHDCFRNIVCETTIFVCNKSLKIFPEKNEVCCLCSNPLGENSTDERIPYCCEQTHARPLKGCLHWVHVGCQFNINDTSWVCPICKHDLKKEIKKSYDEDGFEIKKK